MASPAASNLALTGIATSPGLPILCINRERGVREEEPSKEGSVVERDWHLEGSGSWRQSLMSIVLQKWDR